MVVEISGATIVAISAVVGSVVVAGAMIQAANTYDTNAVSNVAVNVWDRFPSSNLAWVETTMTYPGGPLELTGDVEICFVPPEGVSTCPLSGLAPMQKCTDPGLDNTRHGCWSSKVAGASLLVRYEGQLNLGRDVDRGDPLGFMVSSLLHSSSGTVAVR